MVFIIQVGVTDVVDMMSGIRGPWSMLFWQQSTNMLWFGRDGIGTLQALWLQSHVSLLLICINQVCGATIWFTLLGRRSLLMKLPGREDSTLVISSVTPDSRAEASTWLEVPHGLYSLEVEKEVSGQSRALSIRRHAWSDTLWSQIIPIHLIPPVAGEGNQVCICEAMV